MARLLPLIFLSTFFTSFLSAQDLVNSRRTSEFTYVYQLTNENVEKIHNKPSVSIDESYFHTQIDSFYTDSLYSGTLDYGHYIFVHSARGQLVIDFKSVNNLDVRLLNNRKDLQVIAYNPSGEIVEGLPLSIDNKKVPYNRDSKTYILKKSSLRGTGVIEYQGHTNYFEVSRSFNNKLIVRVGRKIKYSPPFKYLWMPFRDIYRSIRWGYPNGFIAQIIKPFKYDFYEREYSRRFNGYITFNKPIYKPQDTVKFKAFILRKNNRKFNKDLILRVGNYLDKFHELAVISPTTAGNYSYEFVLHDSLNFSIDRSISVYLEKKKYKDAMSGSFILEDYELKSTKYTLRSDKETNRPHQPISLFLKGVDENSMNLLDAKVKLTITSRPIVETVDDQVFLPDTLWMHDQALDPLGETKIVLPDSIFPPASFQYTVKAIFTNSDNEWESKSLRLNYQHQKSNFKFELKADSIHISYLQNGINKEHDAELSYDTEEDEISSKPIKLPYSEKITPYAHSYFVTDNTTHKSLWMEHEEDGVSNASYRTADSVYIKINNEHGTPVWYTLFAGKNEIKKGLVITSLDLALKSKTKKSYFISLNYMWAGGIKEDEYSVPYFDKNLQITTDQPSVIAPGQTSEITINVKDQEGEVVSGVDLTAYAYTSKFGKRSHTPDIPYMGNIFGGRSTFNSFRKKEANVSSRRNELQWNRWHTKLALDSIEYYKFLYPKNGIYRQSLPTPDSSTQFAPFIVSKGYVIPIHIIYLNETPVYYDGVNTISNYSFHAEPNKAYKLKLRLLGKLVEIDSVVFNQGQKSILSIDVDKTVAGVTITAASLYLSDQEKRHLSYYLIGVEDNFNNAYAYLNQGTTTQLLNQQPNRSRWNRNNSYILAGPFYSDSTKFAVTDNFSTDFILESGYKYQFNKGLIKMKELGGISKMNNALWRKSVNQHFGQFATTEQDVLDKWELYKANRALVTPRYDYPTYTSDGRSKIRYWLGDSVSQYYPEVSKMILVDKDDPNFLRIYPRGEFTLHNLEPSNYSMIFLLSTGNYFKIDSINVRKSGTTYMSIDSVVVKPNDESLSEISKIIESRSHESNYIKGQVTREVRQVKQIINRNRPSSSYEREVTGRVTSVEDGSGLPGVNVVIKGTSTGTITDFDGFYTIYIPRDGVLNFSFIGLTTEEVEVGSRSIIDIAMSADVMQLSEVVVTAVGIQKQKKSLGYSVGALQGKVAGVQIRGASSVTANSTPLIVVDGIPITGDLSTVNQQSIKSTKILKGDAATSLYGSRASGGVILITTKNGPNLNRTNSSSAFPDTQSVKNSLRNNFSDYAYWQPNLTSDKNGQASFSVKFPDDVTNWRTFVLGMDDKKHSGQSESSIKAFKPITANLALPRFMISSDTVNLIGKTLNYTQDTLNIKTEFKRGDDLIKSNSAQLINSQIDSVLVTAASSEDSIHVSYSMTDSNGYFDGELRSIPVFKAGVKESKGFFGVLDRDTTLSLSMDPTGLATKNWTIS